MDILTNLHTLSEELFQWELEDALRRSASGGFEGIPESMHGAVAALDRGDGALRRVLADTLARLRSQGPAPAFGAAVTAVVVNAGAQYGEGRFGQLTDWIEWQSDHSSGGGCV